MRILDFSSSTGSTAGRGRECRRASWLKWMLMPFLWGGVEEDEEEEEVVEEREGCVLLLLVVLLLLLLLSELGFPLAALRISSLRKRWTEPEAVSMSPGSERIKLLVVPLWYTVIVSVSRPGDDDEEEEEGEEEEEEEPLRSSVAAALASASCRACPLLYKRK